MASIKVSYQNTVRRFAIPKTITWSELESNLRTLFSLSPTFPFALSYTDEDGDVITLSSDLELQDIFSQMRQPTTLRFELIPYNKQSGNNENNNNEQVIDQPSKPSSLYNLPNSQPLALADEEPFIPTISSVKGKQKAEPSFNNPESFIQDQQNSEEQNNEEQTSTPFIDLAAQFQKVIDQLHPMIEQQPHLIEQANRIMDQILRNIPVNIEVWTQWFNDKIAEAQRSLCSAANVDFRRNDSEIQVSSEEPFLKPRDIIQTATSRIRDWKNGQLVTNEAVNEKLKSLRSMGFLNDNRNEELLKKYKGDVAKVVETLIEDSEYSVVDTEVQMEEL